MAQRVAPGRLIEFVRSRGYVAEPILDTTVAAQEVKDLEIVGYTLKGARGTKQVVIRDADGTYDLDAASLFCDSADYARDRPTRRRNMLGR